MIRVESKIGVLGFELSLNGLSRVELAPDKKGLKAPRTTQERKVAGELKLYFEGSIRRFSVPVDLGKRSPFARNVLRACQRIPWGKVVTYAELTRMAGWPKAARAAGQVMAQNPIPIVIPCHRVVGSDLSLHGFGGGLPMKQRLLEHEGVKVVGGKTVQRKALRSTGK